MTAVLNQPFELDLSLIDRDSTLFPIANIYRKGRFIERVVLTLISDGLYRGIFTPLASGEYIAHFLLFTDTLHTISDTEHDTTSSAFSVLSSSPDEAFGKLNGNC